MSASVASVAWAAASVQAPAPDTTRRILELPTLEWNDTGVYWHYTAPQTARDLARLMGGLTFGQTPEQVGERLPGRSAALHWSDLPQAKEFAEDVRYVWLPMQPAGSLVGPVTACFGSQSYIGLLFQNNALFRISWHFMPDAKCPVPREAAEELFAAFVPFIPTLAISARYTAGDAEVVDVTDPRAGTLIAQRWKMQGQ